MTGYEALANAVVEQAAKDFRAAQRKLREEPENVIARRTLHEIEVFFKSTWFTVLTSVDGPSILKLLKEEKNA